MRRRGPGSPPRVLRDSSPSGPRPSDEAYYLQRTRFESIAERKLRRCQLTEDGNAEEEKLSTSIKRRWRVAITILGAAAYDAGTPSLPQGSRDYSEEGCARQAETVFRERGYSKDITRPKGDTDGSNDVIANFESHYNTVLNKCFLLLEIFGVGITNAGFQIRTLLDAYEGRTYAEFAWGPTESSKYGEVRPYCRLVASLDDQSNCHSEAEFDAFVNRYMK